MKILREAIELSTGKYVHVQELDGGGRRRIVMRGHGDYASFTPSEARALYGALRTLDGEGLLEDS